jgi:hypothetical protein
MHSRKVLCSLILVMLWTAGGVGAARAQEAGRVGLAVGYPASVGVIWHVSDRIALRPDVTLSQSSGDTTTTVNLTPTVMGTSRTSSDTWSVAVGASGLFYLGQWDALRTYVSPRFAYTRLAIHGATATTYAVPSNLSNTIASGYLVSGSFGAQYSFGRRFGVFGEVGVAYTDSTTKTDFAFSTSSKTIGTRSGVGVLFYF